MSKCLRCIWCEQGFYNAVEVNCQIFGSPTTECYKCKYFTKEKELRSYEKIAEIMEVLKKNGK